MRSTYTHHLHTTPRLLPTLSNSPSFSGSARLGGIPTLHTVSPVSTSYSGTHHDLPRRSLATAASPAPVSLTASAWDEDLPFQVYTPEANAEYWSSRPVTVTKRALQVGSIFARWVVSGRLRPGRAKELRADELREILTNLGPAYVKIGQAISSRYVFSVNEI
jgi:hypothetical protein